MSKQLIETVTLKSVKPSIVQVTLKGDNTIKCDLTKLPSNSLGYIAGYGLAQCLRDVYSQEKDVKKAVALAKARWANLVKGVTPKGGGGRRGGYATEPLWHAFVQQVKAVKTAEIAWKDVKAALAKADGEWGRIKVLVDTVGMALSVRAKGREASRDDAGKRIALAYTMAKEAVKVNEKKASALAGEIK